MRARRALRALWAHSGEAALREAWRVDHSVLSIREWDNHWWWRPVVVDGRRLAAAAVASLLPYQSEWKVAMLFVLLLGLYSLTLVVRPYAEETDNRLESLLLLVSTLLYSGQIAAVFAGSDGQSGALVATVAVVSLLAKGAVSVLIAQRVAAGSIGWLQRKRAAREREEWAALASMSGDFERPLLLGSGPKEERVELWGKKEGSEAGTPGGRDEEGSTSHARAQ